VGAQGGGAARRADRAGKLSGLTLSILKGEHGPEAKEVRRLVEFLKSDVKPEIVSLPEFDVHRNGRLPAARELDVPVVCELTGEDIFLDAMRPADRERVRQVIRSSARDVNKFVATSAFYADRMADYLAGAGGDRGGLSRHPAPLPEGAGDSRRVRIADRFVTIRNDGTWFGTGTTRNGPQCGPYTRPFRLQRSSADGGIHGPHLPGKGTGPVDRKRWNCLWKLPAWPMCGSKSAGYVGGRDAKWYKPCRPGPREAGRKSHLAREVTREQKLHLLDSSDVSAPLRRMLNPRESMCWSPWPGASLWCSRPMVPSPS